MAKITGNEFLIKALREEGVEKIFAYPGACVVDIFDELYRTGSPELILPRHEQGLIHAAEGYARSTGKPGVCLVTSGPGATNLITGIADANLDSVPLVCLTGQVSTGLIGNDTFQEVDIVGITRNICKYTTMVRSRDDLNRLVKEAFYIATTGRPGPVLLDLPKDVMAQLGSDVYPEKVNIRGYKPPSKVHEGQIGRAISMMYKAKKPLFLLGGGVKIAGAQADMKSLVEQVGIPAVTTIMGRGSIPTDHKLYFGNVGMHGSYAANNAVNGCDLLISIGTRFNDRITGKLGTFAPNAKIIHIDIDTASISKNVTVDVPVVGDAKAAIRKLLEEAEERGKIKCDSWIKSLNEFRKEKPLIQEKKGKLVPKQIIDAINSEFKEPIITTDVGQNQMWTTQFFEIKGKGQLITSGGLGTMGYGLPAAIGAAIGNPGREVIAVCGDGGFQMNSQEMATAAINRLPIIVCILNNGYLGMVRQWQELFYEEEFAGTCLRRDASCDKRGSGCKGCNGRSDNCPEYVPDFIKLAEAYGAQGIRVEKASQIGPAFAKAKAKKDGPTIIEFIIEDKELVYPMIRPGGAITDLITGPEDNEKRGGGISEL
ncbi:MAG: biosynthetic-type acetolactate synthase large subunit [Bacillota bacterium]|nr:biosynthetic-type acetolactate synthase large subunit [Bacillota bacterium]